MLVNDNSLLRNDDNIDADDDADDKSVNYPAQMVIIKMQ